MDRVRRNGGKMTGGGQEVGKRESNKRKRGGRQG